MKGINFGFKSRFVPLVKSGAKRQTIRHARKDGKVPVPGETVAHCFSGMRTKQTVKLIEPPPLIRIVFNIRMTAHGVERNAVRCDRPADEKRAEKILLSNLDEFAVLDGLESWEEMVSFFGKEHGFPFVGFLSAW